MFKRFLSIFILFIGFSLFASTISAREIEITWEDYFVEVSPGVYEEKENRYIYKTRDEFQINSRFFTNITKVEIGLKDVYPPFEGEAGDGCQNDFERAIKYSDFSGAQYLEFTGVTLTAQPFIIKYEEMHPVEANVVKFRFTVNNQGAKELGMHLSPTHESFEYPITLFRFRITGVPRQRSGQTVALISAPALPNAGALWHEERYVSGVERAYVHMQIYDGQKWIRTGSDNKTAIRYGSRFDSNEFISTRSIRAPHGYNKLVIEKTGSVSYRRVYLNMTHIMLKADSEYIRVLDGDYDVLLDGSLDSNMTIYWEREIDTSNDTVVSSWDELPFGTQSYDEIDSFEAIENATPASLLAKEDGRHDLRVKVGNTYYLVPNILLPSKVNNYSDVYAFYFATSEAHFIWFFFNKIDTIAKSLINDSWLIWNLDTGEWNQVLHSTIHGVPWYEKDLVYAPNVYSDISIPYPIDDIISIIVDFEYRHHYVFDIRYMGGYYGEWQSKQVVLERGQTSNEQLGWWNWILIGFYGVLKLTYDTATGNNVIDNIQDINHLANSQYKTNFINQLEERGSGNYTQAKVFPPGSCVYRLHLGTFNKTGSNGVEVKDVLYSNFTYEYKGVEYTEPFPRQETPDPAPEFPGDEGREPNFFFKLWMWILENPGKAITIAVVAGILLVFGPIIITLIVRWRDSMSRLFKPRKRRR